MPDYFQFIIAHYASATPRRAFRIIFPLDAAAFIEPLFIFMLTPFRLFIFADFHLFSDAAAADYYHYAAAYLPLFFTPLFIDIFHADAYLR